MSVSEDEESVVASSWTWSPSGSTGPMSVSETEDSMVAPTGVSITPGTTAGLVEASTAEV